MVDYNVLAQSQGNAFQSALAGRQQFNQNQMLRLQQDKAAAEQAEAQKLAGYNQLLGEYLGQDVAALASNPQAMAARGQTEDALYRQDPVRTQQAIGSAIAQEQARLAQEKAKATELYLRSSYVAKSKSPLALLKNGFPDYVEQLRAEGVDIDTLSDDQVRDVATRAMEYYGPIAGVDPEVADGADTPFGKINPSEYTPESVAEFQSTGNYAVLRRRVDASDSDPTDKTFTRANTLRDEFTNLTKDFSTVQSSFSTIQSVAKQPSAAGDISLLTSYMRMIDPGSTVREGEFATAQNAAGVPQKIVAKYNQLLNGERLESSQRNDFVNQAKNMLEGRREQFTKTKTKYTGLAKKFKVDPTLVVGEEESVEVTAPDFASMSDADLLKALGGG